MLKATVAFGASCVALASAAAADTPAEQDVRIRELEARVAQLSLQLESLTQPSTTPALAEAPLVTLSHGRPTVQSADGDTRFAVRSLFQYDVASYEQEAGAPSDLNSGSNFRRARLGLEGSVAEDWNYELTFEFGGSGQEEAGKVLAAWIEYAGLGPARVRVGAFAPSVGLDDSTSSGDLIFLERGGAAEMARSIVSGDGRSAIALMGRGDHWFGSMALTGAVATNGVTYDEQLAVVGRLAGAPIANDDFTLHLGANYSNIVQPPDSTAGAGADWIQLRERPELRIDGTRLVDTGSLDANGLSIVGLEAGLRAGRLLMTAETLSFTVDRAAALPDAEFAGWHMQAAWSLTGETRRWSHKSGSFASARPANPFDPSAGHWGAWEIAARHSVLDLNDNETAAGAASTLAAPTSIVRGGEQEITTLGLNWAPNAAVRTSLNYQQIDVERRDASGANDIGQSIGALSLRTQLAF